MECRHNRHSEAAGGRFDNPECGILIRHIEISPVAQLPLPPARLVIIMFVDATCYLSGTKRTISSFSWFRVKPASQLAKPSTRGRVHEQHWLALCMTFLHNNLGFGSLFWHLLICKLL